MLEPHHRLDAARGAAFADDQGEGGEEEEDAPYDPLRQQRRHRLELPRHRLEAAELGGGGAEERTDIPGDVDLAARTRALVPERVTLKFSVSYGVRCQVSGLSV